MAEELKLKGNACLAKGQWVDALVWYTRAIQKYPAVSDPIISACYFNRAICHVKLGRHKEGLQDSDEGLRSGPDDKLAFKLYLKKAECQKSLGAIAGARISFEQALILEPRSSNVRLQLWELMCIPAYVKRVLLDGQEHRFPVNIFDTLPDAYSGAEAPTVITAVPATTSDALSRWAPFTPPSGSLTINSFLQLMRTRRVDLPLVYSFLFYNVVPSHYPHMYVNVNIEHEALDFLLDVVTAELVADNSLYATARAAELLKRLPECHGFDAARAIVARQKILATLKVMEDRSPTELLSIIRPKWLGVAEFAPSCCLS